MAVTAKVGKVAIMGFTENILVENRLRSRGNREAFARDSVQPEPLGKTQEATSP
jgi:hypothetical protein